jgi:hypothetical protein
MTTLTEQGIENLTLRVEQEIRVRASIEKTFAALLEQLGPGNEMMDGAKMPMKLEPWPAAAGSATWATTLATSGRQSNPSSGQLCLSSAAHCLCRNRCRTT